MNNKDFCELFYKEYRAGQALTEDIYKRYQFAVASIALLGGVVGAFSRGDLLSLFWVRLDVAAYYSLLGLSVGSLACASVCLVVSITPRVFRRLDNLEKWNKWRDGYRQELVDSNYAAGDHELIDRAVESMTCEGVRERLADAADWNTVLNRTKLRWFHMAFYFTAAAVGCVALQALMHVVLFLNRTSLETMKAVP